MYHQELIFMCHTNPENQLVADVQEQYDCLEVVFCAFQNIFLVLALFVGQLTEQCSSFHLMNLLKTLFERWKQHRLTLLLVHGRAQYYLCFKLGCIWCERKNSGPERVWLDMMLLVIPYFPLWRKSWFNWAVASCLQLLLIPVRFQQGTTCYTIWTRAMHYKLFCVKGILCHMFILKKDWILWNKSLPRHDIDASQLSWNLHVWHHSVVCHLQEHYKAL